MAHNGLWKRLESGPTTNNQSYLGKQPPLYAGNNPASQLHAQGENTEELNPTTTKLSDATNLKFKTQLGHSKFDLDGLTPTDKYYDRVKSGDNDNH